MKSLSKTNKLVISLIVIGCILALIFDLTFSLINFSQKLPSSNDKIECATAPTNNSYWDEDVSRVDTDWTGSGTESDPWLITSAAELAGLSYTIYKNTKAEYFTDYSGSNTASNKYLYFSNKYFKQTTDIDVSTYWWQPIGVEHDRSGSYIQRYFSGNYNGDGHIVSGVFCKTGSTNNDSFKGLFGYIEGLSTSKKAIINGVGVVDSLIKGFSYVGGIVGSAATSAIRNCFNAGTITGGAATTSVGGILGRASSSIVANCYNIGDINGADMIGGVVGENYASSIANSYNTGSVVGTMEVGGVVGYVKSSSSSSAVIINCYNTGSVTSKYDSKFGGVVGNIYSSSSTAIVLVGCCYYGGNCLLSNGIGSGVGGTEKINNLNSTSYAKNQSWYTTSSNWDSTFPWDFGSVWEFREGENDGYPVFKELTWLNYAATSFAGGDGSLEDPYQIATAEQLAKLAKDVKEHVRFNNQYFIQTANIDLSGHNWIPIGKNYDDTNNYVFQGHYNGNFFTITNMKVVVSQEMRSGGLFGYVGGAELKNIIINNAEIKGYMDTGIVCGEIYSQSLIKNCIVEKSKVETTTTSSSVGGIAGRFTGGTIESCFVKDCSITASNGTAAGICGWRGTVKDCAVLNSSVEKGFNTSADFSIGWDTTTIQSSYAVATCAGIDKKVLYSDASVWSGWGLVAGVNSDLPIQRGLFWQAEFSEATSSEVVARLKEKGFVLA